MRRSKMPTLRAIAAAFFALLMVPGDMAAFAQSACVQLTGTLRSLDRNDDYVRLNNYVAQARALRGELQDMESAFVRGGCQRTLQQTGRLGGQCLTLGRRIIQGREDYNEYAARIETGQAVAQQREQVLQQIARFGCNARPDSRATVNERTRGGSPFQNLFDRLFGTGDEFVDDGYFGYGGQSTLRTVCVRKCDGYYWPVSFSTVGDFLDDDAQQCQSQCPGTDVDLYYYSNPGGTPEEMVDRWGNAYASLPNAFAYREALNPACSCKQQINAGTVITNAAADGGQTIQLVKFENASFPLPRRDPRGRQEEVVVAELVHIPLPKPRPRQPGEEAPERPVAAPVQRTEMRTVQIGGKQVRIVGPDTPYGQSRAAGS